MLENLSTEISAKMQKSIDALQQEFSKIRTGRAHHGLLDVVMVPYYGADVPLSQVATVSVVDSRTLQVTPWEKQLIAVIEKAIMQANLGLTPMSVGESIRVPLPPLTEERRRDLIKIVKKEAEQARVAVRNIRRDANHALKTLEKKKEISEDDEKRYQDTIQKLTDKFIEKIEVLLQEKAKELETI